MISNERKNQIFREAEQYSRNLLKTDPFIKDSTDIKNIENYLDVNYIVKIAKLLEKEDEDPTTDYWQREMNYAEDAFLDNLNNELRK